MNGHGTGGFPLAKRKGFLQLRCFLSSQWARATQQLAFAARSLGIALLSSSTGHGCLVSLGLNLLNRLGYRRINAEKGWEAP